MRGCSRHSTMVSSQQVAASASGFGDFTNMGFLSSTQGMKFGWLTCIHTPNKDINNDYIIYPYWIVGYMSISSKLYNSVFLYPWDDIPPKTVDGSKPTIRSFRKWPIRSLRKWPSICQLFWDVHQGARVFDINRLAVFCERDKMRHKMPEGQFRIMVRKWQALATLKNVRPSRIIAFDAMPLISAGAQVSTTCLYSLCWSWCQWMCQIGLNFGQSTIRIPFWKILPGTRCPQVQSKLAPEIPYV